MKRWIHAKSNMISRIARAKRELEHYDEEQVELVERCYDDVCDEISEYYMTDDGRDVGPRISSIKRDCSKIISPFCLPVNRISNVTYYLSIAIN